MFCSAEAEARYAAFIDAAPGAVVGLDFDGTLAPIVDDPTQAHIHPEAAAALIDLAEAVGTVAIVTGRPARQVLALGALDDLGDTIAARGRRLQIFGQYGAERWDSTHRVIHTPRPPSGLATLERELPRLLRNAGAADAYVEDKGLAVAVHTRRLADPVGAYDRLLPALKELADRHHLVLEPGRAVIEVRSGAADKGRVIKELVRATDAKAVLFVGDDLGDVEALHAVGGFIEQGLAGVRVCVRNPEVSALLSLADVVLEGPDGVISFLRALVEDVRAHASDN
ncbi:trehalose 6-phosphate phosphatase [Nocardioides baekrokdamisoli]|uniref:Trehalose 6-phosphate phosphatase n=1 Tax=Nocardioides baekrokdamisoli TaxID=1804624 RepID=A0A3G9IDI8_9ACTN|nr:trehalose 6-phosphate phosphatase [Nocardioides baekrokdamisoli]